jgi:CheY-like chemotaxis protein
MEVVPHKLLLADDSVTIQRVIELTFADEDVQVIAVGNGADAIDRVQRERPDIVLADVGMPERDGYEVAQFIKSSPNLAHIPVVLLTGAFEPVDEHRARAVGCDGVLVKPFEPQIVISRVKDLLAGKRPSGMWGGGPVAQGPVRQAPAADFDFKAPAAQGDSLEAYFDHLDAAFGGSGDGAAPAVRPANDPIPLVRRPDSAPPAPQTAPFAGPLAGGPQAGGPQTGALLGGGPFGGGALGQDPFADWDPDIQGDPGRPAGQDAPAGPAALPRPFADVKTPPPAPVSAIFSTPPGPAPMTATPPPPFSTPVSVPAPPPPVAAPVAAAAAPAPVSPAPAAASAPAPHVPSLVDAFAALLAAEQKVGVTPSAAQAPGAAEPSPASAPALTDEAIDAIAEKVLARLSDQSRPSILDVAERLVREEIERIKAVG